MAGTITYPSTGANTAIDDPVGKKGSHGSSNNTTNELDTLKAAILQVEASINQANASIVKDLESAKELYLQSKREHALKALQSKREDALKKMQQMHRTKLYKQRAMTARFQLVSMRIEMETGQESHRNSMKQANEQKKGGSLELLKPGDSRYLESPRTEAIFHILHNLETADLPTPTDTTLMRKLARLSGAVESRRK